MSFSQENGYVPDTVSVIIGQIRELINTQFSTTYTEETFAGTNWYKFSYSIAQKIQLGEIKTSEIFQKLQQYIALTNEEIQRPSVSAPGLIEAFKNEDFVVSVKPPEEGDAGKIFVCVDLDDEAEDYAEKKLQACGLIKDFIAGGIVSQGSETESIVLTNGQSFDFSFNLPERTPILLRITLEESVNNLLAVPTDTQVREALFAKINSLYRLGWDFEPQKYFTQADAPWASTIHLEWSDDDGSNWYDNVNEAEYTDLFTYGLEDIEVTIS